MEKKIKFLRTSLYLIMLTEFTIIVYAYINELILHVNPHASWLICIPLCVVFVVFDFISRKYFETFVTFYGAHILMLVAAVFLPPEIEDKIIMAAIAFMYFALGSNYWKSEVNERSKIVIDIPLVGIVIFIIVYVHSSLKLSTELAVMSYIMGVTFVVFFYIREYLDKFYNYALNTEKFTNEIQNTFHTNFTLVLFFSAVIILSVLGINLFFTDSHFNIVGTFFRWILSLIFSLFPKPQAQKTAIETTTQTATRATGNSDVTQETIALGSGNGGAGYDFSYKFMVAVVAVATVLIITILLYKFIKTYLHRSTKTTDEVIKITDEELEKTEVNKPLEDDDEYLIPFFLSNNDKIRRIFNHRVYTFKNRYTKAIISPNFTPTDISNVLTSKEGSTKDKNDALTKIYEEARYSNHKLDNSAVQQAKRNS